MAQRGSPRSSRSASSRALKSLLGSSVSASGSIGGDNPMAPSGRKWCKRVTRRQKRHLGWRRSAGLYFQVPLTGLQHPVRGWSRRYLQPDLSRAEARTICRMPAFGNTFRCHMSVRSTIRGCGMDSGPSWLDPWYCCIASWAQVSPAGARGELERQSAGDEDDEW